MTAHVKVTLFTFLYSMTAHVKVTLFTFLYEVNDLKAMADLSIKIDILKPPSTHIVTHIVTWH